MALLPKLLPDGLLEIFERIYVFDCCFSTEAWGQEEHELYVGNIISHFKDTFPESPIKIFNFFEGDTTSRIAYVLSKYDITIMDYPRDYKGCPLLSLEVIHHFLKSSETWLSLGQYNVLLMHSKAGGWPVLAFMMATLLLYGKHCTGEFKTLDMVHKQVPRDMLVLPIMSSLNPVPSQLRYLQYVSRTAETEWPPVDKALTLDCVIIRMIPDFDGKGGCCPIIRIYGRDPLLQVDKTPKLLFSAPRRSNNVRYYNQAEGEAVKIDINCHIQGDIVLECISLHDDTGPEKMMYRAVFNTAFIKSNMLMFNRDEIDLRWDAKDQFPKDFSTELLFSEMDAAASMVPVGLSCFKEEGLPKEAFVEVQEIFSSVNCLVPKNNGALNRLHEMALSDIVHEILDHQMTEAGNLLQKLPKKDQDKESITSSKSKLKRSSTESDMHKADGQLPVSAELQACLHGCTKSISMPPHINFTCSPPSFSKGPSVSARSPPPSAKKLKPLCWLRLNRAAQGSLWAEAEKCGEVARAPEIDMLEHEPLFSSTNKHEEVQLLLFSEMDSAASMVPVDLSCFGEVGLPTEALAEVQDMFSSVNWLVPKNNAALNRLHEMALSDIVHEMLDHQTTEASNLLQMFPKRNQDKAMSESKLKRCGTEVGTHKAESQLSSSTWSPPESQASLCGCTKSFSMPPHIILIYSPPSLSIGPSVSTSSPPPLTPKGLILSRTTVVKSQSTKKQLKPLRWLKLKTVAQGSLWAEVQKSGEAARVSDIDMSELEHLFSSTTPNSKKAKAKPRAVNKPEGVQLIEHIQAYDYEIMLSKVKIPVAELMDYVLALDDSAMDVDQVENLIKLCPTKEEMELIKGYKGDLDKLGKREQIFLELMRVPRSEAKLRVFSYKLQFNTQVSDLRKSVNDVCLSSEEIRSSVKLRRVMQAILSLGNALNQGTRRGAAVGFRLDSLLNLIETRAENKNMTLMHYLCKVLADKQPELLDFSKELGSLEIVSKIQLKNLAEKMQAIVKGLDSVVHEKKLCKKDGHVSKRFRKLLKNFLASVDGEMRSLASLYCRVGKNVDALILYFGEDPACFPYEQVVSTLLVFVRMFNQAHKENCKKIEAEKKKKKRQKEVGKEKLKLHTESESLRSSPIKSAIALECISLHEKSGEAARASEIDMSELEHLLPNSDKAKAKSRAEIKTKKGQLILHGKPYETDNKPQVASRVCCCSLFWSLIPWWWQRWLDSSPYGDL